MKIIIIFICSLITSGLSWSAQPILPTAKLTVRVLKEDGGGISKAKAGVTFELPGTNGAGVRVQGQQKLTDAEGCAIFEGQTTGGYVSCGARMSGYYPSAGIVYVFAGKEDGRYRPENPTVDVVLKKIINPIPMYARKIAIEIPNVDQVIGFDLMLNDWVIPYGKGKDPDLLCKIMRRFVDRKDHEITLEITFSNEKDGIVPIIEKNPPTHGSELRLPRIAPENGYKNMIKTSIRRKPGQPSFQDAKPDMNYFFRIRTVLDKNGEIKSALYGKIPGDIYLAPMNSRTCKIIFDAYLNPTPNDRNVEWDRSRNLADELTDEQRPSAP